MQAVLILFVAMGTGAGLLAWRSLRKSETPEFIPSHCKPFTEARTIEQREADRI